MRALRFAAFLSLLGLVLQCGCNSSDKPPASTASNTEKPGSVHLEVTGFTTLVADLPVRSCTLSPPGDTIMSGYSLMTRHSSEVEDFMVILAHYNGEPTIKVAGPELKKHKYFTLVLGSSAKLPADAVVDPTDSSEMTFNIQSGGMSGSATFKDWTASYASQATGVVKGPVSGNFTWTCAHVAKSGF